MNPFRLSVAIVVLAGTATQLDAGAPQKGFYSKDTDHFTCDHHSKHKFCHHCDPPFAPILGSAPAMLAPILVTRQNTRPIPKENEEQDQLAQLKELLQILDELAPETPVENLANAAQNAPKDELANRLETLEEKLLSSSERMANAIEALLKMNSQLEELQERLDKLDSE